MWCVLCFTFGITQYTIKPITHLLEMKRDSWNAVLQQVTWCLINVQTDAYCFAALNFGCAVFCTTGAEVTQFIIMDHYNLDSVILSLIIFLLLTVKDYSVTTNSQISSSLPLLNASEKFFQIMLSRDLVELCCKTDLLSLLHCTLCSLLGYFTECVSEMAASQVRHHWIL